jgi:hypothetical protein
MRSACPPSATGRPSVPRLLLGVEGCYRQKQIIFFVLGGSVFEKIDTVFVGGEFRPAKETNR